MCSFISPFSLKAASLTCAATTTRSRTTVTMPRQLRSSTKPQVQTPSTKRYKTTKAIKAPEPSESSETKPPYTTIPELYTGPPPISCPPGRKKVRRTPAERAIFFPSPSAFDTWLTTMISRGHDHGEYWLRLAKKSCPTPDLTYDQALRVALANGWIDGQRKSLPESAHYFLQRFTRRREKSLWSKRNVGIAEGLIADGTMTERGMREVRAAKEDGRWERAYSGGKDIQVPGDFEGLLKEDGKAWERWEALGRGERYQVLLRLETLRSVAGRQKKMKEYVGKLSNGEAL